MKTIQDDQVITKEEKAKEILQCAEVLGLHVNMERTEAIKELTSALEEGTL